MIVKTTVRLPESLIMEVKHLAIDEHKTFQEILQDAIYLYILKAKASGAAEEVNLKR